MIKNGTFNRIQIFPFQILKIREFVKSTTNFPNLDILTYKLQTREKKYSLDRPTVQSRSTRCFALNRDPLICRVKKSDVLSQPQSWKISRALVEQRGVISIARNRINSKTASRTWSSHERVRLVRVATRFELITFDPLLRDAHATRYL